GGVVVREGAARAWGSPGPVVGQRLQAAADISRPPVTDRLAADTQQIRDLSLGKPPFTATQGTQAEGFQDFIGQLTSVGQGDSHKNYLRRAEVKCHSWH